MRRYNPRPTIDSYNLAPPDLDLFDMDERDHERNQAFCRDLEQRMLAWELDPRNFFGLGRSRKAL
jgi:hypothetical protein